MVIHCAGYQESKELRGKWESLLYSFLSPGVAENVTFICYCGSKKGNWEHA